MDRQVWQDHLIRCSKLIVEHARFYTSRKGCNADVVKEIQQIDTYFSTQENSPRIDRNEENALNSTSDTQKAVEGVPEKQNGTTTKPTSVPERVIGMPLLGTKAIGSPRNRVLRQLAPTSRSSTESVSSHCGSSSSSLELPRGFNMSPGPQGEGRVSSPYPSCMTMALDSPKLQRQLPRPPPPPVESSDEESMRHFCDSESGSYSLGRSDNEGDSSSHVGAAPYLSSPSKVFDPSQNVSLLKAELKLVSSDRDVLREELHKVQHKLDNHRRLTVGETKMESRHSSRDYDRLKDQCDWAMNELKSLGQKYSDTENKRKEAVSKADMYRDKYKLLKEQNELTMNDTLGIKARNKELQSVNDRLDQEIQTLQKLREEDRDEINELRQHQRQVITESGSNETLITMLDKNQTIKEDFEDLRKQYTDLLASRATLSNKLEMVQDEKERIQKQHLEVVKEKDGVCNEYKSLRVQLTSVINKWNNELREKKELESENNKLKSEMNKQKMEKERFKKGLNEAMADSINVRKMAAQYKKEHESVYDEYKRIMSERDTVHQEIDQLQDKLQEAEKKCKVLEKEKKTSQDEAESLKQEITSSLHDRDHAMKKMNEIKDKYGDVISEKVSAEKERDEMLKGVELLTQERDVARQERIEALEDRDRLLHGAYVKSKHEIAEEKDLINKETEALKKEIEKLQAELKDAQQEAEVSKFRRDWAFTERDKMVLERESLRSLSDKLRKERDRAVSDLAEALRDSDDVKKQRNEATKELKDLKEKYETLLEKEARKQQLNSIGHNRSRDSAIDADMQEWETETLQIEIGLNGNDLGFDLVGGKDNPHQSNDNSIIVTMVSHGSTAHGKLKVNDQLVKVNNVDVTNIERKKAMQLIRSSSGVINMIVRRRKRTSTRLGHPVHLNLVGSNRDIGLVVENGLYISRIIPGTVAAKEGNMAVGDRILMVNNHPVENMSCRDVMNLISDGSDHVVINVLKYSGTPQASLVSSEASSDHNLTESSPEAPSTSPASPRSQVWLTPSPQENKVNLNLKTSGSQTDSLDNPNPMEKITFIEKTVNKIFGKNTKHNERTPRSKSRHSVDMEERSTEDEIISELDAILDNHSSKPDKISRSAGHKREKRKRTDEKRENGGTWPKCRPQNDMSHQGFVPVKQNKRPTISGVLSDMPYVSHTNSVSQLQKVPPTPPERNDSFNRGASFKHSPQNSDTSSGKYPIKPQTKSSSHLLGTSKSSQSMSTSQTMDKKSVSMEESSKSRNSSYLDSGNSSYEKATALKYGKTSTPDSGHITTDYSVVSAQDPENMFNHVRRRPNRPTSAPSRGQRERRERAALVHGEPGSHVSRLDHTPQKPNSLDVQPIYSPRPLPHTGHITPSSGHPHPMSPKGKSTTPTGFITSTPTSSHSSANSTRQSPSYQVSPHYQCFRNPSPAFQIPGTQNGSPLYREPVASPPYSTPSGYLATEPRGMFKTSIPEMNIDPTQYHLTDHRYSTPSPSPSQHSTSHHDQSIRSPSDDFPYQQINPRTKGGRHDHIISDGSSTFPNRRTHNRIILPKGAPWNSSGLSSSSIEKSISDRESPISPFMPIPHSLNSTGGSSSSKNNFDTRRKKPKIGQKRTINVEKSKEQLGIKIEMGPNGGIFVSTVTENSLAANAGIEVGHQLLEVCGINLRSATYQHAARVLGNCRDSITMLVMYNPKKFTEDIDMPSSDGEQTDTSTDSNSPEVPLTRHHFNRVSSDTITPETQLVISPGRGPSQDSSHGVVCEPRFVFLKKSLSHDSLGISLAGGNAVGIFVREVHPNSIASGPTGLRCGDQLLEFNGTNLRNATAEQALCEISKPAETVSILAQYNISYFNKLGPQGDSFYVKCLFDREADNDGELGFKKDDILYIDNTLCGGKHGLWRAWKVDDEGNKFACGTIPSKSRLEDELSQKRNFSDLLHDDDFKGGRRGSASSRRSFFRRKKHQRNNSKDSRDFHSFSDASINSDSVPFLDDGSVLTFTRVDRLDCKVCRPVLIIGPLAEPLIEKLHSESPDKYNRCKYEEAQGSFPSLQSGQDKGIFIDLRQQGSHFDSKFEYISVSAVKSIMDINRHCLLCCSPQAIERFHKVQIYPIVLFLKYKSTKQIREIKDSRFLPEKKSNKVAKELLETHQKYEQEYRHLFSEILPGSGLAAMSINIKKAINNEQKKTIWIPSGNL